MLSLYLSILVLLGANKSFAVLDDKRIYIADRASKFNFHFRTRKKYIACEFYAEVGILRL